MRKKRLSSTVFYTVEKVDNYKFIALVFDDKNKIPTIGCAEGSVICEAFEYACKKRLPVIAKVTSAGMRVTEGTNALMQMIKISTSVKRHSDRGLLFVSIITNVALGGVSVSLISLSDIIIAENNSIYGFSGKRIVERTTNEKLPADFQTAEYARHYGMVDIVAEKNEIETIIFEILKLHSKHRCIYG